MYIDMRYDRSRGVLTEADRKFLASDKSGYTRQQQYNARERIRKRVINALLDMRLIENHLSDEERETIFDSFDAKNVYSDETETYSDPTDHISCLTDTLAFIYRETRDGKDRHPPFEMILEHALIQGQAEPGSQTFGRYNVSIEVEEVIPEEINIESIVERVRQGDVDQLTEGEMMVFLKVAAEGGAIDPDVAEETFKRLNEEYKEQYGRYAGDVGELLSGDPFGEIE